MSKQPANWEEALVNAGFVDPRNGNPSFNQLAKRIGMAASAVTAVATRRTNPKASTIQKIADALGVDVRTVAAWVGQERTERAPYQPPDEADLLTDRQRRAVDEIIRAIVAERASAPHAHHTATPAVPPPDDPRVADRPVPDGATPRRQDYGLAAKTGHSKLEQLDREADRRGEESQDPGTDEPA